jgi:type IV fimbrial biogenesis protein FimT
VIVMRRHIRVNSGFSIVELMIAITIVAILLTMAVPTFKDASLASQLRSSANNLLSSARLARSEAIKRNVPVTLCVSTNGTTCAGGGWEQGWIVMTGGAVLHRQYAAPRGYRIIETGGQTSLTFPPWGAGATPATLTVCRASPSTGAQERVISIDASGRADVRRTTTRVCS